MIYFDIPIRFQSKYQSVYKDCLITVFGNEPYRGNNKCVCYSVVDNTNKYEIANSFDDGTESIGNKINLLKKLVDKYKLNTEEYRADKDNSKENENEKIQIRVL